MSELYHNKALPNGTILREWRLEQVLGVGGFGIVYRGRGIYFDELVAIKEYFPSAISDRLNGETVAPTASSTEEIYKLGLEKFVEEAKILWNLSKPARHPNIVCVRSLFEIHGTAYMVMDFESGVSLSQMLHCGRRFDEKSLLDIIRPITEGLGRAHRSGVLHRDIKPANILVDETGRPVLIDFGSARFESGQATSTKVTFYTPPYAAIEQYVKTYSQGPWTDIYALGVVLYQCATGIKPPEVLERLHGGLGETFTAQPRPGFSERFGHAVDAAMRIRPSERPQSIAEWLKLFDREIVVVADGDATRIASRISTTADAGAAVTEPDTPPSIDKAPAAPAIQRRIPVFAAAGAVAAAAVGMGIFLLWPSHPMIAPASERVAVVANTSTQQPEVQRTQIALSSTLDTTLDGLIAKAREAGRPDSELAKLAEYKNKITELAAQARAAASGPDAGVKVPAILAGSNRTAAEAARNEADSLARTAARQAKEIQDLNDVTVNSAAAGAINSARDAKKKLDAAIGAVPASKDALAAMNAAKAAIGAYIIFLGAYDSAVITYISDKKQQLASQDLRLREMVQKVVALSGAEKPWILASRERKDAYQTLQDDAAQAKAQVARLDELSRAVGSASAISEVHSASVQVSELEGSLSGLLASSNAASTQLNR